MPEFLITGPDGKQYRVTGDNAEGALRAVKNRIGAGNAPSKADMPSTAMDMLKSGASGIARGAADVVGLPGTIGDALDAGGQWALRKGYELATGNAPSPQGGTVERFFAGPTQEMQDKFRFNGGKAIVSGDTVRGAMSDATGGATDYQPKTTAGEYARTAGEFLPGAVVGGGTSLGNLARYGLVPALTSEAAGQATEGTSLEPWARLGGALIGPTIASTAGGMFGIGNKGRAQDALKEALTRSGKSADEIAADLAQATADGQGSYALADALGHPGQRMLAGVVRSPGDKRTAIVDMLEGRQAGQGRRLSGFLDEAFGSAEGTALQKEAADVAARRAAGNVNFGAAREAAGAVDTSGAIQAIDDIIRPGVSRMTGAGASDNGVYSTLARARSYLTDGNAIVQDFDRAFLAKQEMDAIMEQGGTVAALLKPARNALDDALASASEPYAMARDTYRAQSKAIEAIDVGRNAAKRGRFEDTIPKFQGMGPAEQSGFRTGYVDPLIEQIQGSAMGVNKARPLINDATAAEFPAFALPGKADQLGRRVARENTMFETRNHALGGSRTFDNLADSAEIGAFDPSMIGNALTGNWKGALIQGIAKGANALKGRNQATRDMIADMLMKTGPKQATADLAEAVRRGKSLDAKRMAMLRSLLLGSGFVSGQQ